MATPPVVRNKVSIDLFTDAYRVTGTAVIGAGGIHSELGNPASDFLELQDAYISRIQDPGDIVASYTQVAFRKENINFIVLQNRRDGIPTSTQHVRSVFLRGRPVPVFLTVPSFEIRGEILYEGKPKPRDVIVQAIGRFLPIFVAKASASLYPDISYSGDLILVHKDRIGILCFADV
ncbi:MAG: hypothetical protein AB1791_01105 [Chloroflexota bacterium]